MSRKNGRKKAVEISIEDQLKSFMTQMIWMQEQMHQVKRQVSKAEIKKIIEEVYSDECHRLETLRDDAIQVLNKLVEVGALTREELNEATQK